jgi:hypothetical protein
MSSDKKIFPNMQGLEEDDQGKNKIGGLTPQVTANNGGGLTPQKDSANKIGGLTPQVPANNGGGLTPQKDSANTVGGLTPQVPANNGGGLTPQNNPGDSARGLEPSYSPPTPTRTPVPEKNKNSPEYSPTSQQSKGEGLGVDLSGKKLDFSGLDFKHEEKNGGEKSAKSKKEEKRLESEDKSKAEVAESMEVPKENLKQVFLRDEDKTTVETLRNKSGENAGFAVKAYELREEENCMVCPRKTKTAFVLFKRGEIIQHGKCDTVFCLLVSCSKYFLQEEDQQEVSRWLDQKIKKKLEKLSGQGSREAAVQQCNALVESVEALQSIKKELKECMEQGPESAAGRFNTMLRDAEVLVFQEKGDQISDEKFKELADLGIKKSELKCACGAKTNILVTVVSEDSLVGGRANVHCGSLSCLVQSLERNANMTPSANPKAVELSAVGREHIDESKAKKLHRLIFLGQELAKICVVSAAWRETEKKRVYLSKALLDKKESDFNLGTDGEIIGREKHLDESWRVAKYATHRLAEEIKRSKAEIAAKINELNASVVEDASLLEGQEQISQFNKEIKELESKINQLTLQANEKREQKTAEVKRYAAVGVQNFQVLLEANPFEKIAQLTKMLADHEAKMKVFSEKKLQMEQMSEKMVRFYEEILEIPDCEKLKKQEFENVLDVEYGFEKPQLELVKKVVKRCSLMQMQAKELEKEAWSHAFNCASEEREKNHKDIVDRMTSMQEKYNALIKTSDRLKDEVNFANIDGFEKSRELQVKIDNLERELAIAVEKGAHAEEELKIAKGALKDFDTRLDKYKEKTEGKDPIRQGEEEWSEVVRRNQRGVGNGEGRGGGRGSLRSVSSHGQRGQPQFLNQTRTFHNSSSSSSSSYNPQRDQMESGNSDMPNQSQRKVEREDRDRDGRQEARESERDREEQERFQSQVQPRGPPMHGPYQIPQQQGSSRNFEQNQNDPAFNDFRQFPPGMSGDQFAIAYRAYMTQQQPMQFGNFQDGPHNNHHQNERFQNQRMPVCSGWIKGLCRFGDGCKFQHGWQESQAKRARRD